MSNILNVIVIAAHPDEPEEYAAGTAALYAELGHRVKFLTLTNGDIGHYNYKGPELAKRRHGEALLAAERLGVQEYTIWDISDGWLVPSLENRDKVVAHIREWDADVVITFHGNGGGHFDNRNAGRIVREAAEHIASGAAEDSKQPLFLLMPDFSARSIYKADLAIDITSVLEKKLLGCDAHASQFYELAPWQKRIDHLVPEGWEQRRAFILKYWSDFFVVSEEMVPALERWYGKDKASAIKYAEPFEIADYNPKQWTEEELRTLVPMLQN
ncbi:PIG-L family deacetylase [Paenibacillus albiflavus]|uniref:PIG-L family deacetylase n=1 Tax=Paenibacillus albiflavus TaxID=2545760 RepID=A0A4V2WP84_9BACL|nr:PIG-L family deacetylase [Paenibacillus albiflavus]TCZ78432.1 PIG-L family deacetylase [Paenibacillus albiflavus]